MDSILTQLSQIGIVPVIQLDRGRGCSAPGKSIDGRRASLCGNHFPYPPQGKRLSGTSAKRFRRMLVGAGTVLTIEQAERAQQAGAKFIVSPGLNPKVVAYCQQRNLPITPGCANPSDIEAALELGLEAVKFFPAEQAGGIRYIKAISAPYRKVHFMPTGGINEKNLNDYLSFDRVFACGGSWMVKPELIRAGLFDEITRLCRQTVRTMLGFSLVHVGINGADPSAARSIAQQFSLLFGLEVREEEKSVFAGSLIEVMKQPLRGTKGHIAIGTHCLKRAAAHLERLGISFDPVSKAEVEQGLSHALYLKEEVGGFALHLISDKD